jgi:hypothetical protein
MSVQVSMGGGYRPTLKILLMHITTFKVAHFIFLIGISKKISKKQQRFINKLYLKLRQKIF